MSLFPPCSSDHLQPSSISSELPHKPGEKRIKQFIVQWVVFEKRFWLCCNAIISHLFVSPLCYVPGLVFVFQLHPLCKRISLFDIIQSLSLFLLPLLFFLFFLDRLVIPFAWISPDFREMHKTAAFAQNADARAWTITVLLLDKPTK